MWQRRYNRLEKAPYGSYAGGALIDKPEKFKKADGDALPLETLLLFVPA